MSDLFSAVRTAASARAWSQGVELARGGAVALVHEKAEETVIRVAIEGRRVSPTVTLFVDDQEWSCDCDGPEDACSHVAAGVIALKRGLAHRAGPSTRATRVAYRLQRSERGVIFARVVVRGDREEPLRGAVGLAESRGPSATHRVVLSKDDLRVEHILGVTAKDGWLPQTIWRQLLIALLDFPDLDLRLDGVPVQIGEPYQLLRAEVRDQGQGFCLSLKHEVSAGEVFPQGILLRGTTLHAIVEPSLAKGELALLKRGMYFHPDRAGELVAEILPRLRASLLVENLTARLPSGRIEPPQVDVEVRADAEGLTLFPTIIYGRSGSNESSLARVVRGELVLGHHTAVVPLRDLAQEKRLAERFRREFVMEVGSARSFQGEDAVEVAARLAAQSWVSLSGAALSAFQNSGRLEPDFSVSDDSFTLTFRVPGTSDVMAAEEVVSAWRRGRTMIPLPSGGFAALPENWLDTHGSEVAALMRGQHGRARILEPALLPQLVALCDALNHVLPAKLERLRASLENFNEIPDAPITGAIGKIARNYQRLGINWLSWLRKMQVGGLLADDMGLGKTLQTLAVLQVPALVVVPTSVLTTWEHEAARFRPDLRRQIYHGSARALDGQPGLVLTSYAILRRDTDRLTAQRWRTVVLDEAQLIRNAQSQTAQAAFALMADFRLALSGTPVENRLEDLWSIFHFLNPGLLGGRDEFLTQSAIPIANGNHVLAERLRAKIRPFLLRRCKQDVAKELPPRTETTLWVTLSAAEKARYDGILAATRQEMLSTSSHREGPGRGAMAILAALLRLRQAACHPALLPGNGDMLPGAQAVRPQAASTLPPPSSSKLIVLLSRLTEIIAEGHKALVFSQWTSLLDLIEPLLQSAALSYSRLDGATIDRASVVTDFQSDSGPPIMLISLKAGGLGLTLTAADHVFLVDPWWNPATEAQAIDRVHRIGQTKPVFVHRLVAKGTVEERILQLQENKRGLADLALREGGAAAGLSKEDLLSLLA